MCNRHAFQLSPLQATFARTRPPGRWSNGGRCRLPRRFGLLKQRGNAAASGPTTPAKSPGRSPWHGRRHVRACARAALPRTGAPRARAGRRAAWLQQGAHRVDPGEPRRRLGGPRVAPRVNPTSVYKGETAWVQGCASASAADAGGASRTSRALSALARAGRAGRAATALRTASASGAGVVCGATPAGRVPQAGGVHRPDQPRGLRRAEVLVRLHPAYDGRDARASIFVARPWLGLPEGPAVRRNSSRRRGGCGQSATRRSCPALLDDHDARAGDKFPL